MPQTTKPRLIAGTGADAGAATGMDPNADLSSNLPLQAVNRTDDITLPPKRRRWPWLLFLLVIAAAVYFVLRAISPAPSETPLPQAAGSMAQPQPVFGLGKLVPEGDVITLAPPFGAGDARLALVNVKEGDVVAVGQVLAVLDSEPLLKAAIDVQEADVEVQRRVIEQVRQASMASKAEAMATVESARTAVKVAQEDFDRSAALVKKGVAARAVLEQKEAALGNAKGALERAAATLTRFETTQASGQQDLRVAEQKLMLSLANLRRAQAELEKAYVRAPVAGTILEVNSTAGEKPAANGFATMANLERMTAEVEVYQDAIARVDVGQKVTLTSEALPRTLNGTVKRTGLVVEKQKVTDASPAANTDARVVVVYVDIDPESASLARRYVDLQVTAEIKPAEVSP